MPGPGLCTDGVLPRGLHKHGMAKQYMPRNAGRTAATFCVLAQTEHICNEHAFCVLAQTEHICNEQASHHALHWALRITWCRGLRVAWCRTRRRRWKRHALVEELRWSH